MSENVKKKTNFFKEFIKSIKDLDKYEDFALELPKNSFKYILKLALIFTIIITAFYSYKIVDNLNKIYVNLKEELPEFSYSNGILTVDSEEPIALENYKEAIGKIIIDTNIEEGQLEKYKDEIKNNSLIILLIKNKIVITGNATSGQVTYNYKDIADSYSVNEFTKQDAVRYIEDMNVIYIYTSIYFVIFIYLFVIYFITIIIDVLILSILVFLIARISRIKFKFATVFNIAAHAITLSIVLNLIYIIVNLLTGFYIKNFQWMYNTISYIYAVVAVLMIKTDFINRQMELIKIAQEQEKVREELQKQKEEQEKNKEENKDKEKKQKENTDKKPKDENGELEGGVNPSVIQENK